MLILLSFHSANAGGTASTLSYPSIPTKMQHQQAMQQPMQTARLREPHKVYPVPKQARMRA